MITSSQATVEVMMHRSVCADRVGTSTPLSSSFVPEKLTEWIARCRSGTARLWLASTVLWGVIMDETVGGVFKLAKAAEIIGSHGIVWLRWNLRKGSFVGGVVRDH